jgi:hypothetical protein
MGMKRKYSAFVSLQLQRGSCVPPVNSICALEIPSQDWRLIFSWKKNIFSILQRLIVFSLIPFLVTSIEFAISNFLMHRWWFVSVIFTCRRQALLHTFDLNSIIFWGRYTVRVKAYSRGALSAHRKQNKGILQFDNAYLLFKLMFKVQKLTLGSVFTFVLISRVKLWPGTLPRLGRPPWESVDQAWHLQCMQLTINNH